MLECWNFGREVRVSSLRGQGANGRFVIRDWEVSLFIIVLCCFVCWPRLRFLRRGEPVALWHWPLITEGSPKCWQVEERKALVVNCLTLFWTGPKWGLKWGHSAGIFSRKRERKGRKMKAEIQSGMSG